MFLYYFLGADILLLYVAVLFHLKLRNHIIYEQLLMFPYSPSDQAILEAEYKLNPKSSKAARAEIVEKVTLNEKEVQVRHLVLGPSRLQTRLFIGTATATDFLHRYGSKTDGKSTDGNRAPFYHTRL